MKRQDSIKEAEAAVQAAAEVVPAETAEVRKPDRTVVVLAWPGTKDDMERAWKKFCTEDIRVIETDGSLRLADLLADIIADNGISLDFILTPANLIPMRPVTFSELSIPTEDVSPAGAARWGRTPVRFDKEVLAELLPGFPDCISDEDVTREYQKRTLSTVPYQVGHDFGNYFTKVLRANPCENVVIEGFVRKHFIYSSADGWPAFRRIAEETIFKV